MCLCDGCSPKPGSPPGPCLVVIANAQAREEQRERERPERERLARAETDRLEKAAGFMGRDAGVLSKEIGCNREMIDVLRNYVVCGVKTHGDRNRHSRMLLKYAHSAGLYEAPKIVEDGWGSYGVWCKEEWADDHAVYAATPHFEAALQKMYGLMF